jgi:hypothetical protein
MNAARSEPGELDGKRTWDWGGTITPLLAIAVAGPVTALSSGAQRTVAGVVVAVSVSLLREPAGALVSRIARRVRKPV